ncbi:MAG: hypothetical protein OEU44_02005 [Gammaproteobacteria bacterium]|nr:hypothetical protein [Gammaproteobacteria bacterium]
MASVAIRNFKEQLERDGVDYRPVTPTASDRAHIRFTGSFQGDEVIWDAVIVTLAHEFRELYPAGEQPAAGLSLPQFIEVGATADGMRKLRVGLNVPRIDAAVLHKTIIMIRNYKRLRPGRHEYEPAWKSE